jgi:N-acetylglucosaminyldiphosphoundecaprenol N-acetyl-beta-D-mannosaminyltransferase
VSSGQSLPSSLVSPRPKLRLVTTPPPLPTQSFTALGIAVSVTSFEETVELLLAAPSPANNLRVQFATAETLRATVLDSGLRDFANETDLIAPDDAALVLLGRLKRKPARRIRGEEAMVAVLEHPRGRAFGHYFIGGQPGSGPRLLEALRGRFAGLEILGSYCPPQRPLDWRDIEAIARRINQTAPDYVWIGSETPRRDRWLVSLAPLLNAPVLVALGTDFSPVAQAAAAPQARAPATLMTTLHRLSAAGSLAARFSRLLLSEARFKLRR